MLLAMLLLAMLLLAMLLLARLLMPPRPLRDIFKGQTLYKQKLPINRRAAGTCIYRHNYPSTHISKVVVMRAS